MKNIKKLVLVTMVSAFLLTAVGCSDILESIASRKAISTLDDSISQFLCSPTDYVDVDSFDENQLSLALDGLADVTYTIDEDADLNSSRNKAEITVTFENVRILEEIPFGTEEQVNSYLESVKTDDVDVTFTLTRDESTWELEDASEELFNLFYEPYSHVAYIDENGMPTSFNQVFFDECVVASVFYDPIMGNPLDRALLENPVAIEMVVYFDRPMYIPLTAELVKNDSVVQTIELNLDGLTIANCDFSGQIYSAGSYEVNVYFDGGLVASSDITVTN